MWLYAESLRRSVYKHALHNLLHEHPYPTLLVFGVGGAYHSLVSVETPVLP
jgi:hypothetical protein